MALVRKAPWVQGRMLQGRGDEEGHGSISQPSSKQAEML